MKSVIQMKTIVKTILVITCFLILLPTIAYPQQKTIKLRYDKKVKEDFRLITDDKSGDDLGEIKLSFRYFMAEDGVEKLQLYLEPALTSERYYLLIIDEPMEASKVAEIAGKLSRSNDPLLRDFLDPFWIETTTKALEKGWKWKTGIQLFRENPKSDIIFLCKPSSDNSRISFHLYYVKGNRKVAQTIEKKIKPFEVELIFPNHGELCKELDIIYADIENFKHNFKRFENRLSEVQSKSKTEKDKFIKEIKEVIADLKNLEKLNEKLNKDPLARKCPTKSMELQQKLNDDFKLNRLQDYQDLLAQAEKAPQIPITQITETAPAESKRIEPAQTSKSPEPAPAKKEPPARRGQPHEKVETCDDFNLRMNNDIDNLKRKAFSEPFTAVLTEINTELNLLTAQIKAGTSEEEKDDIKKGIENIDRKNNDLLRSLQDYQRQLESVRQRINERLTDCKVDNLIDDMEAFESNFVKPNFDETTIVGSKARKLLEQIDEFLVALFESLNQYQNSFNSILQTISNVEMSVNDVSNHFEQIKYSGKYYPWKKKNFLKSLAMYDSQFSRLTDQYKKNRNEADSIVRAGTGLEYTASFSDTTNQIIALIEQKQIYLESRLPGVKKTIEKSVHDAFPWAMVIFIFFGIIILVFGSVVYFRALRKKQKTKKVTIAVSTPKENIPANEVQEDSLKPGIQQQKITKQESQKVGGIKITRTVQEMNGKPITEAGHGLEHVYENIGIDYYEIDLEKIWEDTLVKKVFIHRACIRKTYKFFYESCDVADEAGKVLETGGYLIGGWDFDRDNSGKYNVSLEDFIEPGDDAVYGEYQLNFGAKIGVRLEKTIHDIREKLSRDYTLTGWFHSHPEIKIFLSNHDLDVQERLSSPDHKYKLLALVIDPNTQDDEKIAFYTGIFSYKSNGTMNNNKGKLELIKWKALNDWARTPPPPSVKDYYCLEMTNVFKQTLTQKLYFNDKSITKFSLFLDELNDKPNTHGWFLGQVYNDQVLGTRFTVINNFVEDNETDIDQKNDSVVGIFVNSGNGVELQSGVIHDLEKINQADFLVLCKNSKSKDLSIITRKEEMTFNVEKDASKTIPFAEIETWPTRRR